MKLNLLPTHVSKEKATKGALFGSIFLFLLCVVFALFLFSKGKSDFTASTDGLGQLEGEAQRAIGFAAHRLRWARTRHAGAINEPAPISGWEQDSERHLEGTYVGVSLLR